MGYRIKTVSEITGIPKNTLVAWERRYGILNPERLPNGYRRYSDADIAVLQQLKGAMADGLKISEAVDVVLSKPRPKSAPRLARRRAFPRTSQEAFDKIREELFGALMDFNRPDAEEVVSRMMGTPHEQLIEHVYYPLLRVVGERWVEGDVSVAQEHFASAFVRDQLIAMLLQVGCGPQDGMHVACVTFPGERHELGVLGLAVRLALAGCRVTYLGVDLPSSELCTFAKEHQPELICISLIIQPAEGEVAAFAERLQRCVDPGTRVAIGGAGLPKESPPALKNVTFLNDWYDLEL